MIFQINTYRIELKFERLLLFYKLINKIFKDIKIKGNCS